MAKDPVCGMDVKEEEAAARYEYKGQTYYFCAVGCKEKFSQDTERFITEERKLGSASATSEKLQWRGDDEFKFVFS